MLLPYLFRADRIRLSAPSGRHLGSVVTQASGLGHHDFLSLAPTASFYCSQSLLECRAKNLKKKQLSVMTLHSCSSSVLLQGGGPARVAGGMCTHVCLPLRRWVCTCEHSDGEHVSIGQRRRHRVCVRVLKQLSLTSAADRRGGSECVTDRFAPEKGICRKLALGNLLRIPAKKAVTQAALFIFLCHK